MEQQQLAQAGIIPAYAGSTICRRCPSTAMRDHPRIRGEHKLAVIVPFSDQGSSPHTRGAPRATCRRPRRRRDHPRIRGEHRMPFARAGPVRGSSPHTRGAPEPAEAALLRRGIIPAYAGSTIRSAGCKRLGWDHPRIRGEHSALLRASLPRPGIIPAYAGSTFSSCRRGLRPRDHPRIRGEHS